MAVNIQTGGKLLFPLTSRPAKPIPHPPVKLIAKTVSYGDRDIIVTIPFPDTIELVAVITNEVLAVPDWSGKSVKMAYSELGSGLIDQSQKMTVAAMQMAYMKVCAHRS